MNKVVELYNQGASHEEIAAGAGISISSVARSIRRAKNNGELPEKQPADPTAKLNNALRKGGVVKGSISEMLLSMPKPAQHWVMVNVPDGATVAELAAAVLMDAYYDEMGDDVTQG